MKNMKNLLSSLRGLIRGVSQRENALKPDSHQENISDIQRLRETVIKLAGLQLLLDRVDYETLKRLNESLVNFLLLEKVSLIDSSLKEELFQTLTNLENFCQQLLDLVEQNSQELSSIPNKEVLSLTIGLISKIRELISNLENPNTSSEREKDDIRNDIAHNMSSINLYYSTIADYYLSVCGHARYHFSQKSKPQS